MAYTLEIADSLAKTLRKFVTLNSYQLAGHVANIDFWKLQVEQALAVIDGYDSRERARTKAQREYIREHDTRRFFPDDLSIHQEFPEEEPLDHAAPDRHVVGAPTLQAKRREITDAFYGFLRRGYKDGLLSGNRAKEVLAELGLGVEAGDFRE